MPKQKRKRWRPVTTESKHREPVAQNWLAKMPAPDRPDQVWVADITYVDTGEGWLYLAGILDACTRRLVGWQTGETLAASLVTRAWQKAVREVVPDATTLLKFRHLLEERDLTRRLFAEVNALLAACMGNLFVLHG